MDFLGDYKGYIHADAYGGYDQLFQKKGVIEVGCWAHARREFHEALGSAPGEASEVLSHIRMLYQVEKQARELSPEERRQMRETESRPSLDRLFERLELMAVSALPQSPIGSALTYALNQRKAFYRYLEGGRLAPDNNTAENAIRPLALGRKNWLFTGSERGRDAAAIIMSLAQTCKKSGIDPWRYFDDVLRRIMGHNSNRLDELLPGKWAPAPEKYYPPDAVVRTTRPTEPSGPSKRPPPDR